MTSRLVSYRNVGTVRVTGVAAALRCRYDVDDDAHFGDGSCDPGQLSYIAATASIPVREGAAGDEPDQPEPSLYDMRDVRQERRERGRTADEIRNR